MPTDETDYYSELWAVIREQERLVQARRLLEGLRALPEGSGPLLLNALKAVDELIDASGRATHLRAGRHERSVQRAAFDQGARVAREVAVNYLKGADGRMAEAADRVSQEIIKLRDR